MASNEDKIAQFVDITSSDPQRAQFFLDTAGGDVDAAVAYFFESSGNDDAEVEVPSAPAPEGPRTLGGSTAAPAAVASPAPAQRGTYTLDGRPAEPLLAGWGANRGGSSSSSRFATPSNPLRSNTGPRVTGFRDLAAASSGPSFGGGGRGGGDDDSDDDDSRDPTNFFTGGAKSGLSVENPDAKKDGGMRDMIKGILQQAREGSQRLAGAEAESSGPCFFGGSAHTLGSDETPSTYIPDPTKDEDDDELEEEEEQETAIRHLTFWQDGFSIEDGDLMKYDEHKDLLAAIQSGRAPLSLLKVKHDQPVELRIAERRHEQWTRQPPPPVGPWGGQGNRLGSVTPSFSSSSAASASMPGSFGAGGGAGAGGGTSAGGYGSGASVAPQTVFEVDRNEPTTQLQIRLSNGERLIATFNHTHTIGDVRSYVNASQPSSASSSYALQASFPPKPLDDKLTLKEAGMLGSVIVQRPL
ncbi:hypothetical protein JCM8547_007002 [Rhodosporidiobolus lusitaniae]